MKIYMDCRDALHARLTRTYGSEAADVIIQEVAIAVIERGCESLADLYRTTELIAIDYNRVRDRERQGMAGYRAA